MELLNQIIILRNIFSWSKIILPAKTKTALGKTEKKKMGDNKLVMYNPIITRWRYEVQSTNVIFHTSSKLNMI